MMLIFDRFTTARFLFVHIALGTILGSPNWVNLFRKVNDLPSDP